MPASSHTPARRSMSISRLLFLVALIAAGIAAGFAARPAHAEAEAPACSSTVTVANGNDSGAGSLRQAIADVCDGGTIYFGNDMTVTLASALTLDKPLTIEGQERTVTISGNHADRVFFVSVTDLSGEVHLNRLTISNGSQRIGGAILNNSPKLTIDSCTLTNSLASEYGGAIYNYAGVTIQNSTLTNNTAGLSGGAIYDVGGSGSSLTNVTITANSGGGVGGLELSTGDTANNTIIAGQLSGENCDFPSLQGYGNMSNTTSCGSSFRKVDNLLLGSLGDYGGDTSTIPLLPGSPAIDAGNGNWCTGVDQRGFPRVGTCDIGAFESQGFNLSVTGGNNQIAATGAGFASPLTVSVAPKQPGEPVNGGQVTFAAPASGASATLSGSPATIGGGGASVTATANGAAGSYNVTASARGAANATFSLTNCPGTAVVTSSADSGAGTLRQAIAEVCPGGTISFGADSSITLASQLAIAKSLTIDATGHKVTVSGNNAVRVFNITGGTVNLKGLTIANGKADGGGGILATSTNLTVSNSTFSGNTSDSTGGAIELENNCSLTATNTTFSGNVAAGSGGALYNNICQMALTNVTMTGNGATYGAGGGLFVYQGVSGMTTTNSIVAGSTAGGNCGAGGGAWPVSSANSLSNDSSCSGFTQVTSMGLGTLGDYGGGTPTIPLLPGSPAIDAGNAAGCPSTDQRGSARAGTCDAGAFESQGFTLTAASGNNQAATVNTSFANPLAVSVAAKQAGEPVNGGQVTFTPPASGASASLSGSPVTISGGSASVSATANGTTGSYIVSAAAKGASSADFNLTNACGTPVVTSGGDSGPGTLRQAISDICAGGVITFNGDYVIILASPLTIAKGLTIDATGHTVTVSGNNAKQVFNITAGPVTLRGLTIANANYDDFGGGIATSANLTVDRCTLANNHSYGGGAIYVSAGTVAVTNSTFSGNVSAGAGGALYNGGGAVTLTNVTMWGGSAATSGGGFFTSTGAATTKAISTVVGGSTAGSTPVNCSGKSLASGSKNNLTDSNGCFTFTPADSVGLDALGSYGGTTQTMRLQSASPAIDGGASCPSIDQRGQARDDYACDIGAFELKLSDSATVTKSVVNAGTFTFGPTMVKIVVNGLPGCLTGITVTRHDANNPNATSALMTGRWWEITPSPAGCTGFNADLTLPTSFTPDTTGQDTVCYYLGTGQQWDCGWTSSTTNSVTRAGLDHFSQWAVGRNTGSCAAPATPAGLSISAVSSTTINLNWPVASGANLYEVWTAQNAPYFDVTGKACASPSPYTCSTTTGTTYSAAGLGDPAANRSYVVRAANNCGQMSGVSNRAGGFGFTLVKGN